MNRTRRYVLPAVALSALAPLVGTAAARAATKLHARTATKKARTYKYTGPIVDTQYGPVAARIYVKNRKITEVKIGAQPDTPRSVFIQEQAAPLLRQEVLKAQSARIDDISGATYTSEGFIQSLQKALKAAKHAKQLK